MAGIVLPAVSTNWGFLPGSNWEGTATGFAQMVKDAGYKTVICRIHDTPLKHRKEIKAAGLILLGWEKLHQYPPNTFDLAEIEGVVPEIEFPDAFTATLNAFKAGWAKDLPKAIVTTYSGLEQGQYAQLVQQGVKNCFVECYRDDALSHADLNRMMDQGVAYGIPRSDLIPMVGTYRQEKKSDYIGLENYGGGIAIYLPEPMTADTWKEWSNLPAPVTPPPPPPPPIPNPSDVNMADVTNTETWLNRYEPDQKALSRLRIVNRISRNGVNPTADMNSAWVKAAPEVKAVLDKYGISS